MFLNLCNTTFVANCLFITSYRSDNFVDEAVFLSFGGGHPEIALHISVNFGLFLASVFDHYFFDEFLKSKRLFEPNLLVGDCTLRTARWLMNHHRSIGQKKTFALSS